MIQQHGTLNLSRTALAHNLALMRSKIDPAAHLAVLVKANAYGHGARTLAPALRSLNIHWLCVFCVKEAAELLDVADNIPNNILVLSPVVVHHPQDPIPDTIFHPNVAITLTDELSARAIAAKNKPVRVHVQIDVGLTRAGIAPQDAPALISLIQQLPNLKLEGIFAHLSHGEVPNHPTLAEQHRRLMTVAAPLKRQHPHLLIHLQNSGATETLQHEKLDMVRIGIAAYGLQPDAAHPIAGLQPIASLTAPIIAIHDRPEGTGVGYNHLFTTTRKSRLAVVPVGYGEGYPRALTGNAIVELPTGRHAPVVGRISMDQIVIDITDHPTVALGDTTTVISNNPAAPNSVAAIAQFCGTIPYEITTGFGCRIERRIVE